eukprot:12926728-Prorocentrum_lima.AAC.1
MSGTSSSFSVMVSKAPSRPSSMCPSSSKGSSIRMAVTLMRQRGRLGGEDYVVPGAPTTKVVLLDSLAVPM